MIQKDEKKQLLLNNLEEERRSLLEQEVMMKEELKEVKKVLKKMKEDSRGFEDFQNQLKDLDNTKNEISAHISILESVKLVQEQINDQKAVLDSTSEEIENLKQDFNYISLEQNRKVFLKQQEDQKTLLGTIPRLEFVTTEQESVNQAMDQKNETEVELSSLMSDFDEKTFDRLKKKVEKLKEKKIQKETLYTAITKQQIPDKKKQILEITQKEKKLKSVKLDLKIAERKLDTVTMIREFTKEIVPLLRRQHVRAISEFSSEIFSFLMLNEEYEGIEITDDYELKVQQSGKKYDLTILSGGEQVIACLAIRLAIAKLLANQDIMLLDEPTVMLDAYRRKELVEVFDRTKPVKQTIIVTHDTEFERVADTTFTIIKRAGKAQVIAEEIDEIVSQHKKYQVLTQERFAKLEL
jgi:exonuclease SbcC